MGHVLVAVCVEDLRVWWHSIYYTSLIVTIFMIFQFSCHISVYLLMYHLSSFSMETILHYILYVVMTTHDICLLCLFMAIVLICIRNFYVYFISAVRCRYLSLYYTDEWLVLPPGSTLLHFWDYYNAFRPSCIALTSHIRGLLL